MREYVPGPWQEISAEALCGDARHGLLQTPGLGKTASWLDAFMRLKAAAEVGSALVIAPLRVCATSWPGEIRKWRQFSELTYQILRPGSEIEPGHDLYLTNPEALPWLLGKPDKNRRKWLPGPWRDWSGRPDMLCVDEAHRFKRASGVRARTLARYLPNFSRRSILTGSPMANGLEDLHGQMKILDLGESLHPTITAFRGEWMLPRPTGRRNIVDWTPRPGAFEAVMEKARPRVTVLSAKDWITLPPLVKADVEIELPKRARRQYRDVVESALLATDDETVLFNEEATSTKLRQIANGAVYKTGPLNPEGGYVQIHKEKLNALWDLVQQIGAPTLVVYEFLSDKELIRDFLCQKMKHDIPVLGGGTSAEEGVRIERAWNAGEVPVLLAYPQEGLNLQEGGHHMVWYGPPWDLLKYDQMTARLHRLGQERPTFVYHIVARGTIENRVGQVLCAKDEDQGTLFDTLKEQA